MKLYKGTRTISASNPTMIATLKSMGWSEGANAPSAPKPAKAETPKAVETVAKPTNKPEYSVKSGKNVLQSLMREAGLKFHGNPSLESMVRRLDKFYDNGEVTEE